MLGRKITVVRKRGLDVGGSPLVVRSSRGAEGASRPPAPRRDVARLLEQRTWDRSEMHPSASTLRPEHRGLLPRARGLTIGVRSGQGSGRTTLAAFDAALVDAGVADFNLVRLSSIIPPGSRVMEDLDRHPLAGGHGDLLYCVYAAAYATHPDQTAWAGISWAMKKDGSAAGLFVEHDGHTRADVEGQLSVSLEDLAAIRGRSFEWAGTVLSSATCDSLPVCAIVIAPYASTGW